MPSTNQTPNLKLSQFTGGDKPSWRQDYNEDMSKIDEAYGSISGESGELTQRVSALENDIPPINQAINGLQTSLNQTNVNVNNIDTRVTTNENEISALDSRVDATENAISQLESANSWIIVGDSYGAGSPNYMSTLIALNPQQTIYNACKSGAGFTVSGNTFLQNLQTAAVSIQNKGRVGKILFLGGGNDIANSATGDQIKTAVSGAVQYCKSTFPNAIVYIGFLWGSSKNNFSGVAKANCIINYKEAAKAVGAAYIPGMEDVCHRYGLYFGTDSSHPNARGAADIGGIISAFCTAGVWPSVSYVNASHDITSLEGFNISANAKWGESMKDGFVQFYAGGFDLTPTADISPSSYTPIAQFDIIYANGTISFGEENAITSDGEVHGYLLRVVNGMIYISPQKEAMKANTTYSLRWGGGTVLNGDYC